MQIAPLSLYLSSQRLYPHLLHYILQRSIFPHFLYLPFINLNTLISSSLTFNTTLSLSLSLSLSQITKMDLVVITEFNPTKITHVNKKSSDELLRKFADPDVDESKSTKRRKKTATTSLENGVDIESNTIGLMERKRLLLAPASKRRSLFLRQLASGKSHLRNKSLVRTIGKTWRKTMEGASRVFIEKHYNRHRRLINDVV